MTSPTSHRRVMRATFIIGGASIVGLVIGIIRAKTLALTLGPAGVGTVGLYTTILGTVGGLVGWSFSTSGVRQISDALARGDVLSAHAARRALVMAALGLGVAGMGVLWSIRSEVSTWVFGNPAHASTIGWLGLGVLLGALAAGYSAMLQGYQRLGELARIGIIGTAAGSLVGVIAIVLRGERGLALFMLAVPLATLVVARSYTARLGPIDPSVRWPAVRDQLAKMAGLGAVFMVTVLLQNLSDLLVRSWIVRDLGLEAGGQFQAAWSISMQYVGFILGAMAVDYLPRLTSVVGDREASDQVVNEQMEVTALLATPVLLGVITVAPILIRLLYSEGFGTAAEILRWQALGDVFKIFSWPIGFILIARGAARLFLFTECLWQLFYLGTVGLGLSRFGLPVTGMAFVIANAAYIVLLIGMLHGKQLFRWTDRNARHLVLLALASGGILLLAQRWPLAAVAVGGVLTVAATIYCVRRLDHLLDLRTWLRSRLRGAV